jgi:hypothetical protein
MGSIHVNQVINNHDIVIPFELLKSLNHQEVDIVIFPKKATSSVERKKNALAKLLGQNKKIKPFQNIKDPVVWQRNLRNEW